MNLTHVCTSQMECSLKQLMLETPEFWSAVIGVLLIILIICAFKRFVR